MRCRSPGFLSRIIVTYFSIVKSLFSKDNNNIFWRRGGFFDQLCTVMENNGKTRRDHLYLDYEAWDQSQNYQQSETQQIHYHVHLGAPVHDFALSGRGHRSFHPGCIGFESNPACSFRPGDFSKRYAVFVAVCPQGVYNGSRNLIIRSEPLCIPFM